MPVHKAGPRLGMHSPFKHLANKHAHGGKKDPNGAQLNLTPMVNMMTMLVVFLLSTFSATGEIMMVQRGLKLPSATQKKELQKAPLLIITNDTITLNGEDMGVTSQIKDSADDKIPILSEKLTALQLDEEANFTASPGEPEWPARIILQADRAVPSEVLNKVTTILYLTKWRNIAFAVEEQSGAAPAAPR